MTYPVIVICIAIAITTFLIVRVVPVFGEIFADFGANLPAPDAVPARSQRFRPRLLVDHRRRHRRRVLRHPRLSSAPRTRRADSGTSGSSSCRSSARSFTRFA